MQAENLAAEVRRLTNWFNVKFFNESSQWLVRENRIGRIRLDFCPRSQVRKYEPRVGYVICKIKYTDLGCLDLSSPRDELVWVKDRNEQTAVLDEDDTFKPFPDCHKDEFTSQLGGN